VIHGRLRLAVKRISENDRSRALRKATFEPPECMMHRVKIYEASDDAFGAMLTGK
jgi:hypothetical protein